MKDLVRIVDYKRYLKEEYLPWAEKKNEELKKRYAEAKEKYESGRLAKFFGWEYEKSDAGSRGWYGDWYGFYRYDEYIDQVQEELTRLTYLAKIKQEKAEMKHDFYKDFYRWCELNNIPY